MKIGLLTPERGGSGGYERLLARLRRHLGDVDLEVVTFDGTGAAPRMYGLPVPHAIREHHEEFFTYLATLERMDRLELDRFDVLLATHAPTYLVRHPAVVALFYHQHRIFYDLSDEYVASGFVDPLVHEAARREVRAIDDARVGSVHTWLAGSEVVAARLDEYWGIRDNVRPFRAAPETGTPTSSGYDPSGPALCVSRHEWPKRTELVVGAAHVPRALGESAVRYELVGDGSRHDWLLALAARYRNDPESSTTDEPPATWLNTGSWQLDADPPPLADGNLCFHGEVADAVRDDAYDRCGVVIAPAYQEDYGLTVLEAFAHGRPVIVCDDGGGLVELVEGTGAGVVVAPDPRSIDDAVRELRDDPTRARAMSEAARDAAAGYRHENAVAVLVAALRSAHRS